ncbi:ead/Ea22-like family protein [Escherichia coli]
MSNIDKRALREAAEKATPGPWYVHDKPCEDGNYGIDTSDKEFLAEAVVWWGFSRQSIWREEDAKHIAAANPATVLALLDELEAAEKRIAELNEFVQHVKKCLVKNDEYAPLSHEVIDTILGINAAGITVKGE